LFLLLVKLSGEFWCKFDKGFALRKPAQYFDQYDTPVILYLFFFLVPGEKKRQLFIKLFYPIISA